jgi:hypothetical protein
MDRDSLTAYLQRDFPGFRVVAIEPLAPDATRDGATAKAAGYGEPHRLRLVGPHDRPLDLVWRVATPNELGHDRRADRAAESLLAYDDFAVIPEHVAALDLGAACHGGRLVSIRDYDHLFVITPYAAGTPYAAELRELARAGAATDRDRGRVDVLARYLADLHQPMEGAAHYRRAVRDLVGSGEGIYGVVDAYPDDVPAASRDRLAGIERRCAAWRWTLRSREGRLCRTHGDFHPFNILFDGDRLALLDASRGTGGDPADDVTALAVNYVLFALDTPGAWAGLGPLWHQLWSTYIERRHDSELTKVAPPFFAWRALVVCNPTFYPNLSPRSRAALLDLAERALDEHVLEPGWADELFA